MSFTAFQLAHLGACYFAIQMIYIFVYSEQDFYRIDIIEDLLKEISIPTQSICLLLWPFKPEYTEAFKPVSGSMWQSVAVCGSLWHYQTTSRLAFKAACRILWYPRCYKHLWLHGDHHLCDLPTGLLIEDRVHESDPGRTPACFCFRRASLSAALWSVLNQDGRVIRCRWPS